MEGTFPTLCEKTRQERAGWNQSGNRPLGRSALSRAGRTGRESGGGEGGCWTGSTSQTGSTGGRAGSSFEDLKDLFGPRTFPVGHKAQCGLSVPSPLKQSPPLHWAALTLQRTTVTVLCMCVCASVLQAAGPPRGPGAAGAEGLPTLASPPGRGAELPGGNAGVEVKPP